MKGIKALNTALAVLALGFTGLAQAAATNAVSETTDLPEVQVVGKRLYQMRKDIINAENKFFAKFNELNKNDEFDIHCVMNAETGTHLKKRLCRVQFYEDAQRQEAQARFGGPPAPSAELVALERGPEYKKAALTIINAHPELLRLVKERDALEKKYDATRKQRFKGRWILFE
jgi:hypothetical protein